MKTIFSTLVAIILTFVLSINAISQVIPINTLSCSVFETITFNGVTIPQLQATGGNIQAVTTLFGQTSTVETHNTGGRSIRFVYGQNGFSFIYPSTSKEYGTIPGKISGLTIRDSNWIMSIQGVQIQVGMQLSEVEELLVGGGILGDVKLTTTNTSSIGQKINIFLECNNEQKGFIDIDLDPNLLVVTEIAYWVLM